MRLFTAVCLEPELQRALEAIAGEIRQSAAHGRFTRRENFHLTLSFIGETDRPEAAKRALEQVEAAAFWLKTAALSAFHRSGGDICYLALEKSPALEALQRQQAGLLREAGFVLDQRPFRPHLTLGRDVRLYPDAGEANRRTPPVLHIPVRRVSLMQSERVGGRLCYTEIAGKDLIR